MEFPPAVRIGIEIALALFAAYMAGECWMWRMGNRFQLTPGQLRRRLAGALLLIVDLVLWLQAETLLQGRPPREKLLYLLLATLLALLPMMLAVREAGFVIRQYARARAELIRSLGRHRGEEPPRG